MVGTPGVLVPVAGKPSVVVLMFFIAYLVFQDSRLPERLTVPWGDICALSVVGIFCALYMPGGIVTNVGAFKELISNRLVVDVIFSNVFWNWKDLQYTGRTLFKGCVS